LKNIHRSIPFLCLTLALLLCPAISRAQAVHAWEGSITIPTYKLGPADPNPSFPLVRPAPVYPYTMLDNLTNDRVMQKYRAIYLENEYLKITILPELGGHVYSVYDKHNHREVFYRDHVIKYGLVGPRGAWIAGGMEFSFPFAHTTDTISAVESILHQNTDGSATATVGAVDWVSNMHWEIAITLRPDTARLEEGVTLFNSTPLNNLYLFWTNAAVKATDDAHYIYPMRETVFDDPFATVESWPTWKGVDRSWYKNDPDALAIFGRNVHRNFFGMYYQDSNYGVVHVADFRQDPGKKFWTWGTARSGKIWDKILSDNDGSYNEIQSGRFYTQGSREFMNPHRVEKWTEYWYPVSGLNTGFVEATNKMAINVGYVESQANVTISPVERVNDATVSLKEGETVLKEFSHVNLMPLEPASYSVAVPNVDQAKKDLTVQIASAQGQTLLQWSAADPIDGNPDMIPSVGKAIKRTIDITPQTPVEELYLQGLFLQKTENEQGALKIYDQVLARDPGYVPALLQKAWIDYRAADFKNSESLIARAMERDNDVNESATIAYASGVIHRADGNMSTAKEAFWNAIHYGSSLPPGASLAASYVELGEIAIRQKNYAQATDLLEIAVGYNPDDAFALADLAVAERLAGNSQKAAQHSTQAVQKMPLLPYALAESWMDGSASQQDASWTKIISSDPQNYLAVASWYHNLGAWESSDKVLHDAIDNLPQQAISPMVYYYLASNARFQGNAQQAEQYATKAASRPASEVFPNRLTDAAVLAEAIQQNPSDAHAQYALGNFLFAHARYGEAAKLWMKALDQGFNNAVLLRNLGVYQWRVKKNLTEADSFYVRAIRLNPNDYRLYTDLDDIYEQQGNTEARVRLFNNAPQSVLDQDTVRARRALRFLEQSKPDEALALLVDHRFKPWEGGVVVRNMFVAANMEKGKSALASHQPAEAAEAFRRAMQYPEDLGTGEPSQPDNSEQLYWLGNALQAQGKTAEANAAWKQAALPGSIYSGLAEKKLGHEQQAKHILDRYIQAAAKPYPKATDYYRAGLAEQFSGDAAAARNSFQHALELDPALWEARIAMDAVQQPARKAA
jgi:tetratricopeptide (TPR) repeat protein